MPGAEAMSAHPITPQRLRQQARRLDRRLHHAEAVMNAMRAGAALHLQYDFGSPIWSLTDGTRVDAAAAAIVITNPKIVSVGDALFADVPAQTYRYVATPKGDDHA
jgi:hypothetical protein